MIFSDSLHVAQRETMKRYRRRIAGESVPFLKSGPEKGVRRSPPKHGTENEYLRHRCRCEACKEFGRVRGRLSTARNPQVKRLAVKRCQEKKRDFIRSQKDKPCTDCNTRYPFYVMHFDHKRDKSFELSESRAKSHSIKRIEEEIAKCDLVCANCHSIRTYRRMLQQKQPCLPNS